MSKYKEALKSLANDIYFSEWENWMLENEYIKVLKELVDKEKPMKPIADRDEYELSCPVCKQFTVGHRSLSYRQQEYCHGCGQHLDWSKNE